MYTKENLAKLKKMDGLASELVEAAMVAASLRAGAAVTHATHFLPD